MGYFGINMPTFYRTKFCALMREAGYTYISLEELRVYLGAVLISTEKKAITESPSDIEYVYWGKELQASLELLDPELRMQFITGVCIAHEQTKLRFGGSR